MRYARRPTCNLCYVVKSLVLHTLGADRVSFKLSGFTGYPYRLTPDAVNVLQPRKDSKVPHFYS